MRLSGGSAVRKPTLKTTVTENGFCTVVSTLSINTHVVRRQAHAKKSITQEVKKTEDAE